MTETWKPVVGFEELYEVSDRGRVRSLPRRRRCVSRTGREFQIPTPGRIRALTPNSGGYLGVSLCRDGAQETMAVHRLVLEAFAGPCPPGMQTLHGPGGKLDNRWPENLSWGFPIENAADRERDGTAVRGERHAGAVLTTEHVRRIRSRYEAGGVSRRTLAQEFGVSQMQVWRVLHGKSWGHVNHLQHESS